MRIFLLEDDSASAQFIANGLTELGHSVRSVANGRSAVVDIAASDYDVLVLDRMVPDLDGLSVLRIARASGCQTPALLLTALGGIEDRVAGLNEGADDYLVKPFAFVELVARLNALSRRPATREVETILRAGEIEMDMIQRSVRRKGKAIELQPREFSLLEQLVRNAGRIVTRTMLLDRVWNFGFDPKTNIVETHMSRLRTKLNEGFSTNPIRTVRGSGYVIDHNAG
jgi:two-component system OmpR family response regulator